VQARGGWKKEESRIKQEFDIKKRSARKAGRLPTAAAVDAPALSAPAKAALSKKEPPKKPRAASAPALSYKLAAGSTKKEQKLADDVAKVMSKLVDRVEKRVEVTVCLLPLHHEGLTYLKANNDCAKATTPMQRTHCAM
jgi:hypothetical protein